MNSTKHSNKKKESTSHLIMIGETQINKRLYTNPEVLYEELSDEQSMQSEDDLD